MTRMLLKDCALQSIVDVVERKVLDEAKAGQTPSAVKVYVDFGRKRLLASTGGLHTIVDKLLKMNICKASRDVELKQCGTANGKDAYLERWILQLCWSHRVQDQKASDWIEDGNIRLTVLRSPGMCEYGVPTLEDFDWEKNKKIVQGDGLVERYGRLIFVCALFGGKESEI